MANPAEFPQQQLPHLRTAEPDRRGADCRFKQLSEACLREDAKAGEFGRKVILIAGAVSALAALFFIQGAMSLILCTGIFLFGTDIASTLYHKIRPHPHLEAAKALSSEGFRHYLMDAEIPLTVDTLQLSYQRYREHAIQQAQVGLV